MAFKSIVQTKIYSVILNVISVGYAFLSSAGKNVLFFLDEIIMQHQVSKCVKKKYFIQQIISLKGIIISINQQDFVPISKDKSFYMYVSLPLNNLKIL